MAVKTVSFFLSFSNLYNASSVLIEQPGGLTYFDAYHCALILKNAAAAVT